MAKKNIVEEKRKARRTLVQESFQLYLVIPKVQGMVRIYLRDISSLGVCFKTENANAFKIDQNCAARVYINPSFYLPLDSKVVRVMGEEVALEFSHPQSPAAKALAKLQEFLEAAEDGAVLVD